MNEIKLLKKCLLIQLNASEVTREGIHLTPESAERAAREATYGRVVIVGPDAKTVKVGDFVLYKQYVGNELKHSLLPKDFRYIVVSEDDLLAIVPEDLEVKPSGNKLIRA